MKKIILILVIFLFMTLNVKAEECSSYLSDLKVIDHVLTPEFNKYNNLYTLIVEENVINVNFDYKLENEKATVKVLNKTLEVGENNLYLEVNCEGESEIYQVVVTREEMVPVNEILEEVEEVEVMPESDKKVIVIVLLATSLILIIMIGILLFKRRKK